MSGPWRGPPMPSFGSTPGGDSILITSAPKSANWRTQVGPARTRERSRIRRRDSAGEAAILGMRNILAARLFGPFKEDGHEKTDPVDASRNRRADPRGLRDLQGHRAGMDAGQQR